MSVTTRLFLDTEWADAEGDELVSLALVTEDGLRRFYAEVSVLPTHPTDFVRRVVYPLLDRGASAVSAGTLSKRLRAFLTELPAPRFVIHDYHRDAVLMRRALSGSDSPESAKCMEELDVYYTLVAQGDLKHHVESYFQIHSAALARRHHAAVDAEALRRAYRCAVYREPLED